MNPGGVRRALHHVYTLAAVLLLATGVLLGVPDLRAHAIGGYGRETWQLHIWIGWAFCAVPFLALAAAGRPLWRDLRRRLGPPDGVTWRKLHTVFTIAAGIGLGASGVLLWLDLGLPLAVGDAALEVHVWLSWALGFALVAHVIAAWRKIVSRTREVIAGGPTHLFEHADDPGADERGDQAPETDSISTGMPRGT